MDLHLQDKIAFIAGSTRGIGLAIARAFLDEGQPLPRSPTTRPRTEGLGSWKRNRRSGAARGTHFPRALRSSSARARAARLAPDHQRRECAYGEFDHGRAQRPAAFLS